jgi:hypothetical protein
MPAFLARNSVLFWLRIWKNGGGKKVSHHSFVYETKWAFDMIIVTGLIRILTPDLRSLSICFFRKKKRKMVRGKWVFHHKEEVYLLTRAFKWMTLFLQ